MRRRFCDIHGDNSEDDDTSEDIADSEREVEDDTKYAKPSMVSNLARKSSVTRNRGRDRALAYTRYDIETDHCAYIEKFID